MSGPLCWNCKLPAEPPLLVDDLARVLCANCQHSDYHPELLGLAYLQATIPYKAGDRVHASTAGEVYDGIGTVREVSTELRHGGSPVHPSFLVEIDDPANPDAPDKGWYTEPCLRRAEAGDKVTPAPTGTNS